MKKKQNNCWECPHQRKIHGSAHISCNFINSPFDFLIALRTVAGRQPNIVNKETGEPYIELHETGLKNGWAAWPLNFDPVWVTCHLNIEQP